MKRNYYLYIVKKSKVNIDFQKMAESYRKHVRRKAILAGSAIVYVKGSQLIKEDPKSLKKKVLIENIAETH